MKECSKAIPRRLADSRFVRWYFRGRGLDVGGGPDPLRLYQEFFPLVEEIRTWDREDGDAQQLASLPEASLDFLHSSHCLEHLKDPADGLRNWLRVLRPGGYLVVIVPDEDLYEQGVFPSDRNADHRWTFTIWKASSWSPRSLNLLDLLRDLGEEADVQRIEILDDTFRFGLPRYDQTLTPVGECGIEVVVRKRPAAEIAAKGRLPERSTSVERELRVHLNQYRDDRATLRRANGEHPPFRNEEELG